jgi:uncharacterized protein YkwD
MKGSNLMTTRRPLSLVAALILLTFAVSSWHLTARPASLMAAEDRVEPASAKGKEGSEPPSHTKDGIKRPASTKEDPARAGTIVCYPAKKQGGVPCAFETGETPDPVPEGKGQAVGFPITVTFHNHPIIEKARMKLHDEAGKEVECWFSTPDAPANPKYPQYQTHTICCIPKKPLAPNTVYTVTAVATISGSEWSAQWEFRTGEPTNHRWPLPQEWKKEELEKIMLATLNSHRELAGVRKLGVNPRWSEGCMAHAKYLDANWGHPATEGLKAHEEDSSLPGYSKEGERAGRRSVIWPGCGQPAEAVDVFMTTLYHRVVMLDPQHKSVGFGFLRRKNGNWIVVIELTDEDN